MSLLHPNDLERDGLRLRKLGYLIDRGDWQAHPNSEASPSGSLVGPNVQGLVSLRSAIDNSTPQSAVAEHERTTA